MAETDVYRLVLLAWWRVGCMSAITPIISPTIFFLPTFNFERKIGAARRRGRPRRPAPQAAKAC